MSVKNTFVIRDGFQSGGLKHNLIRVSSLEKMDYSGFCTQAATDLAHFGHRYVGQAASGGIRHKPQIRSGSRYYVFS